MISIITVNFNCKEDLNKTLKSIKSQDYDQDLDVIIIDGGSTDGSQELVKNKYNDLVSFTLSEKDNGIYDAMNKGIKRARGEWIYFLNAGDVFYSNAVITQLNEFIECNSSANFIYAPYISDNIINNDQSLSLSYLTGHMINHQSIIFKRELFENTLYDTRYRYCADYAHLLNSYYKLNPVKTNFVIANYDSTGISSLESNKAKMWKERIQAILSSNLHFYVKAYLLRRAVVVYPLHYLKALVLNYANR